jgi:pyruvate ferredoxin oxidoreductase alpha subunit
VRTVARQLRENERKVGVVKLWLYRPFPSEELSSVICNLKVLAVFDKAMSFGAPNGPLCSDVASMLQDSDSKPKIFDVICGLGGRDVSPEDVQRVFNESDQIVRTGVVRDRLRFLGVRE